MPNNEDNPHSDLAAPDQIDPPQISRKTRRPVRERRSGNESRARILYSQVVSGCSPTRDNPRMTFTDGFLIGICLHLTAIMITLLDIRTELRRINSVNAEDRA
jgi:hypothetical protein